MKMKRFIALLLAFVVMMSATGCTGGDAETMLGALVEEFYFDSVITYYPNGGVGGPTEQKFKSDGYPRITEEKPTREGYHFIGWTRLDGGNEPYFFPGAKTLFEFGGDMNLYACWEKSDSENPFEVQSDDGKTIFDLWIGQKNFTVPHDCNLVKEYDGMLIRLQCSCGYEYSNKDITLDQFVKMVSNGQCQTFADLNQKEQEAYKVNYMLYCTQEVAPLALMWIAALTNDAKLGEAGEPYAEVVFDTLDDLVSQVQSVAEYDLNMAMSVYAPQYSGIGNAGEGSLAGNAVSDRLQALSAKDSNKIGREIAEEVFGTTSEVSDVCATAIAVSRVLYYNYNIANSENDSVERASAVISAAETILGLLPFGDLMNAYYGAFFSTLQEGLKLYADCLERLETTYVFYDQILEGKTQINDVLDYLDIQAAMNGTFEASRPTVEEVLNHLVTSGMHDMNADQKRLTALYLSSRLEYDMQQKYGITLEQYLKYIQ